MRPDLTDFEGHWQLTREIEQPGAPLARFDGVACFVAEGAGLAYREEGRLAMPGQAPVRAGRRYLWRAGGGGVIEVAFHDGGPFHRIDMAAPTPSDRHHCGRDVYDVAYDFAAWPVWAVRWRVTGPRKDYRIRSVYRR